MVWEEVYPLILHDEFTDAEKGQLLNELRLLCRRPDAAVFVEAVTEAMAPGYGLNVEVAMDLNSTKRAVAGK